MTDAEFALSRKQREEILKAVGAIERQLKEMTGTPPWQGLYVISTNLAIIRMNAANTPRTSAN